MSKLNHKEEKLKDILGGLEIEIDTNDIWGNIESELPKPKKKRRFGIIFFSGLLALILIGATWLFFSQKDDNNDSQKILSTITNDKIIADKSNVASKTEISKTTYATSNESSSKLKTVQATSDAKNKIASKKELLNFKIGNSTIVKNTTDVEINDSNFTKDNVITPSNPLVSTAITNTQEEEIVLQNPRALLSNIINAPTLSSQLFEIAERQYVEGYTHGIYPIENLGRQLLLQLKLGANQNKSTIYNLNSISEFDPSEFDFESDRLGLSGSFAIGVENNGWRFLAGISYHQNVSTYQRNDVIIIKDQVTGIKAYKIDTDGNVSAQNGVTTATYVSDNAISFHRQHKAIDFHATIGKRLWSYKGLMLIADAGFGINTYTASSGYYIEDKAFGFTKISDTNHPYKINTHWNAIASLELGYNFGKTRVGISPFLRYNPNSITEQNHFYQLKNSQVGLQLSLTYSPTRE